MYNLITFVLVITLSVNYADHTSRIIGGTNASIFDYNYYVLLLIKNITFCGASLVTTNKIVTAAHCVRKVNAIEIKAYPGLTSLSHLKNTTFYRGISAAIHQNYTGHPFFDIAVIELEKRISLSDKIQLIPLAASAPPEGAIVIVVGYGRIVCKDNGKGRCSPAGPASNLQKAEMIVQWYEEHIMVTDSSKSSTCFGDSGGPFIYKGHLVAVVSQVREFCDIINLEVSTAHPDIRKHLLDNIEH